MVFYTVGHSNHTAERFVELLRMNGAEAVADVRRFAASRVHPQFNGETLAGTLHAAGIGYVHLPALGGRRRPDRSSALNGAWEHAAFRGYADYALTDEFQTSLADLIALCDDRATAYMCAEGLWWQCHRRIITDWLLARGHVVRHITPTGKTTAAELTPFAHAENGRVTYPGLSGAETTNQGA